MTEVRRIEALQRPPDATVCMPGSKSITNRALICGALADGMAPLPQFFQRLKLIGYDGIVSLHSEYKGASSFRRLTTAELLDQSAADLRYLKQMVAKI